jgi:hypothetical protein
MSSKVLSFTILVAACHSIKQSSFVIEKVPIADECTKSCPPQRDPSRFIFARNQVTYQLGMVDSECFFGRNYNCVLARQNELDKISLIDLKTIKFSNFQNTISFGEVTVCQATLNT